MLIKKIVEEIIKNHTCPECNNIYSEQDIILSTNINKKSVDLALTCSKCSLHWIVRADVYMWWVNVESDLVKDNSKINDQDIIDLSKKLKWNISASDIFNK